MKRFYKGIFFSAISLTLVGSVIAFLLASGILGKSKLPNYGCWYCEALNTTIDLSAQEDRISFSNQDGTATYTLLCDYGNNLFYTTENEISEMIRYGSFKAFFEDKIILYIEEFGSEYTFCLTEPT